MGDIFRISKAKRTFKKGYLPNWTEEIFTIATREQKREPEYQLGDFNKNLIEGKFYEKELQEYNYLKSIVLRK